MRKNVIISLLFVFQSFALLAQNQSDDFADVTFALGNYQGSLSVLYVHNWRIGKLKKLGIGLGGRITSYLGANQYYITAPAKLTSESTSPLIFFKENIARNIDSLLVKSPWSTSINASINIDYRINTKIVIGFNIDAIGFSFGRGKRANYINGYEGKNTEGKPTPFNLLLISDNDKGMLNSELYMHYLFNERWAIKAGPQFLFTEYTTVSKVQQAPSENDRFRRKSLLFGVGVSYQLNNK